MRETQNKRIENGGNRMVVASRRNKRAGKTEGRKRELITTVQKLPQPLLRNPGNVRRQPIAEFAKGE